VRKDLQLHGNAEVLEVPVCLLLRCGLSDRRLAAAQGYLQEDDASCPYRCAQRRARRAVTAGLSCLTLSYDIRKLAQQGKAATRKDRGPYQGGANPSCVGPKSRVEPSERCALHIACLATARHPAAFTTELLERLGRSQVPLDWTRISQLPVSPEAAATALGACPVGSQPNPVAVRWVFRMAGQGVAGAAGAASGTDPEALILAGAKLLRDVPCWIESPHYRHEAPDVRLPIHAAAVAWDQTTLALLLEAGADIRAPSSQGFSGALTC